jgi:type IV pilus assembly protein PilM
VAVEISPERVVAARVDRRTSTLAQAAQQPLAAGAVVASATERNIEQPTVVSNAVRTALEKTGAVGREAVLLVPDLTARVSILDFETLPQRDEELLALVRFRLRKTLPFDADGAAISAQRLSNGASRVLVAVADRARLNEYEDCMESAGARPVIVLPAGLAALSSSRRFDSGALLLKADSGSATSAFAWDSSLRFFRVIETEAAEPSYEEVYPSIAFYRDFVESQAPGSPHAGQIITAGITQQLLDRLKNEVDWAEIRQAAPERLGDTNSSDADRLLAVAGALSSS